MTPACTRDWTGWTTWTGRTTTRPATSRGLWDFLVQDYTDRNGDYSWSVGRLADWKYNLATPRKYAPIFLAKSAHLWLDEEIAVSAKKGITLYTGSGTNTSTKRFWGMTTQVWDNTTSERAYLRNSSGALRSKAPGSSGGGGGGGGSVSSNCHASYADACLRMGVGDYDWAGGSGNGPNYIAGPVRVVGPDEFDLDRDGNGIGCQS